MSFEISKYICDVTIEDYFLGKGKPNSAERMTEVLENLKRICVEYDRFTNDLEIFFNHQIKEPKDLDELQGNLLELSDETERVFFPFKKVNGELKFAETDTWRSIIMAALLLSKSANTPEKEEEHEYEYYSSSQLQFSIIPSV